MHSAICVAFIRAHQRRVKIRVVRDLKNASAKDSLIPDLRKAGIAVEIPPKDGNQHSKYLIVDQGIIMTGSYSLTARADERNSEDLLIICNAPKTVKSFEEDCEVFCAGAKWREATTVFDRPSILIRVPLEFRLLRICSGVLDTLLPARIEG